MEIVREFSAFFDFTRGESFVLDGSAFLQYAGRVELVPFSK